jgi:glutaminase
MATCGVYDFTGEWVYRVGMPAKSGVGGGIVAVLPGQLGIGVFSPALDERGNSVRGVKVCEAVSAELGLHFLLPPRASSATVRTRYTVASVRSKRRRSAAENSVLDAHGDDVAVFELQGDLRFTTVEQVLREVLDHGQQARFVVLDFKRVTHADPAATRLLARLVEACGRRTQHVVMTRVRRRDLLADFGAELDPRFARAASFQPQLDRALEWCERGVLERHGATQATVAIAGLAEHSLCAAMTPEEIGHLEACAERVRFEPGSLIVRRGEAADALFLLLRGEASVVVDLPRGGSKRLSTLSAGMSFGETALIDVGVRSADVRADSIVECCTLGRAALAELETRQPALMIRLLRNALRLSHDTAARLTAEVAALEG